MHHECINDAIFVHHECINESIFVHHECIDEAIFACIMNVSTRPFSCIMNVSTRPFSCIMHVSTRPFSCIINVSTRPFCRQAVSACVVQGQKSRARSAEVGHYEGLCCFKCCSVVKVPGALFVDGYLVTLHVSVKESKHLFFLLFFSLCDSVSGPKTETLVKLSVT